MNMFSTLQTLAARYRRYRQAVSTERLIADLPTDVRKDIGWPPAGPSRYQRHSAHLS